MGYLSVKKAFTLPELLIVITIMVFIIAGALTVYLLCYKSWQEAIVQASLQRDGSIATEKLVRGVRGASETKKNGIREAKSFTIPILNNSAIQFVSGVDSQSRSFYLDSDKIIYDPDTLAPDDEVVAAKDIESLSFEKLSSQRIKINMTLPRHVNAKIIFMFCKYSQVPAYPSAWIA